MVIHSGWEQIGDLLVEGKLIIHGLPTELMTVACLSGTYDADMGDSPNRDSQRVASNVRS